MSFPKNRIFDTQRWHMFFAAASDTIELWRSVFRLLGYSSQKLSLMVATVTIAEAAFSILSIWLIKVLIDTLSNSGDLSSIASEAFIALGLAGSATVLALFAHSIGSLLRTRQGMLVADFIDREIHQRAITVDLGFYESPAYFDSLQRARQAGTQRPAQMVSSALGLGKSVVFLIAVMAMLGGIEWRLLPVLCVAVGLALLVRIYFTRRSYEWQRRRVQLERRAGYFDWLLTSDIHAKELRLHDLGEFCRNTYAGLRKRVRDEQLKIESSRTYAEIGVAILGASAFVASVAFILVNALSGELSIGDLVLFVLLFRRAEQSGRELVSSLSQLYENQLYLKQLFDFLETEAEIRSPAVPQPIPKCPTALSMQNVSFGYPSKNAMALSSVDLEVRAGQIVALVGENGSGKTTLIKLLTRLYDPLEGSVNLNGMDIRSFDPIEYRKLFSVIFQDFAKYAATASDNIWFGDASHPRQVDRIKEAASKAAAAGFLESLPKSYDTPLSRIFDDGQELSIGQWQRVALARAFFPDTRFIIMDEPTSAIDPHAEMELFDTLRERIGNRGALIISHRFSTIRHADYAYVLRGGFILEHGTHDELIKRDGSYARLFSRQASYFR